MSQLSMTYRQSVCARTGGRPSRIWRRGCLGGALAIFMHPGILSLYFRLKYRGSIGPSAAADVEARGGWDAGELTGELGVVSAVLRGVGARVTASPCCGIYAWLHLAYTQQRNRAQAHEKVKTR